MLTLQWKCRAALKTQRCVCCVDRFNAERVASGILKLKNARKNVSQKRMDRCAVQGAKVGSKDDLKHRGVASFMTTDHS